MVVWNIYRAGGGRRRVVVNGGDGGVGGDGGGRGDGRRRRDGRYLRRGRRAVRVVGVRIEICSGGRVLYHVVQP